MRIIFEFALLSFQSDMFFLKILDFTLIYLTDYSIFFLLLSMNEWMNLLDFFTANSFSVWIEIKKQFLRTVSSCWTQISWHLAISHTFLSLLPVSCRLFTQAVEHLVQEHVHHLPPTQDNFFLIELGSTFAWRPEVQHSHLCSTSFSLC